MSVDINKLLNDLPISAEKRAEIGLKVLMANSASLPTEYTSWATNWLSGSDRTADSAKVASRFAVAKLEEVAAPLRAAVKISELAAKGDSLLGGAISQFTAAGGIDLDSIIEDILAESLGDIMDDFDLGDYGL